MQNTITSKSSQFVTLLFGIFLGLGVGVVLETKAAPVKRQAPVVPEVVQAQRFEVVDKDGTVRMQMGAEADGGEHISLFGKSKKEAVVIRVDATGNNSFSLRDQDGAECANIAVSDEKGAVIALSGKGSQPIAALAVLPDGSQALSLIGTEADAKGKRQKIGANLLVLPDGKTQIAVYGKNGKSHVFNP